MKDTVLDGFEDLVNVGAIDEGFWRRFDGAAEVESSQSLSPQVRLAQLGHLVMANRL